jgi:hypothetical protein
MSTTKKKPSAQIEQIKTLFGKVWEREKQKDTLGANDLEQQIAKIVGEIAKSNPGSAEHAEALHFHECAILSLARIPTDRKERAQLRYAAYALGIESVDIQLADKKLRKQLGTVFHAYNLAIDLIVGEKRYEEGLKYMLISKRLFKKLPRKARPSNYKLFDTNYGIAKAYVGLGKSDKAKKVLRKQLAPKHVSNASQFAWHDLRGLAKCAELLAAIDLKERRDNRQALEKAAAAKQKAEAKTAGKEGKEQAAGNDPTNSK